MNPRSRTILLIAISFVTILVTSAIAFYFIIVKIPTDLAHGAAQGFREFFNFTPRVTIDQVVVIEQNTPIAELATVARDIHIESQWSHTWLGSTKAIRLRGVYTAKAGFDLNEPFTLAIKKTPFRKKITAEMPYARLLSLELKEMRVLMDESGWWNRISTKDREEAIARMQSEARTKAERSGMIQEAQSTVEERIKEIIERNGATAELRLGPRRWPESVR